MKNLKLLYLFCTVVLFAFISNCASAQYKEFKISAKGDTINAINKAGEKTGKWVITMPELRGNPGYDEEGVYAKNVKEGYWRRYTAEGDLFAVENYLHGGKDGLQQYFSPVDGSLVTEESWRGYNPDAPYDTIAIYGTGSNEIVDYKIVKAEQYSVKQGPWKYYEAGTGRILRTEQWERNNLVVPGAPKAARVAATEKKKVDKTPEMLEWEKKNKGKKNVVRDGRTGL